jgi:hypothetical protein
MLMAYTHGGCESASVKTKRWIATFSDPMQLKRRKEGGLRDAGGEPRKESEKLEPWSVRAVCGRGGLWSPNHSSDRQDGLETAKARNKKKKTIHSGTGRMTEEKIKRKQMCRWDARLGWMKREEESCCCQAGKGRREREPRESGFAFLPSGSDSSSLQGP